MSPVPKKRHLEMSEDSSMASDNDPNSGLIRFEVDKVSSLDATGRYSPIVEVGGVPWSAIVRKRRKNGALAIILCGMQHDSKLWKIDVDAEFTLVNADSSKNESETKSITYKHDSKIRVVEFDFWEEIVAEEEGFIKSDQIVVEIRFSIKNMEGIWLKPRFGSSSSDGAGAEIVILTERAPILVNPASLFPRKVSVPRVDFLNPNDPRHNIALLIDGEKVYANKELLSIHSPVFKAMFYGNFIERGKKEIELKDANREGFIKVLDLIYKFPSDLTIAFKNAKFEVLLEIADRFQIKKITDLVEKFLCTQYYDDVVNTLRIANLYGLVKLREMDEFEALSDEANFSERLSTNPDIDFTDPNEPYHDVAFAIDGEKIYANKTILGVHSRYFHELFDGHFDDGNQKEIELKDVDRAELVEMLRVFYSPYHNITDDNVEILLKLGDRFQSELLLNFSEDYLMEEKDDWGQSVSDLSDEYRLYLSEKYNLVRLKGYVLNGLDGYALNGLIQLEGQTVRMLSIEMQLQFLDNLLN